MVKTASTKTSSTKTREQPLWNAANKMWSNLREGEYRHIFVGPVFPKCVSENFPALRQRVRSASSIKSHGNQMERR